MSDENLIKAKVCTAMIITDQGMAIKKLQSRIKELEKENANLLRDLNGKPEHWSDIIHNKNQELESLDEKIKTLEAREKILMDYYKKIEDCAVRVIDADDVFTKDMCISCLSKVLNETREALKKLEEMK